MTDKAMLAARAVLAGDRDRARKMLQQVGDVATLKLLKAAQADLEKGLREAEGLRGPGKDSFTAAQKRATLAQVTGVIVELNKGIRSTLLEHAPLAGEQGADDNARYLVAADQAFRGVGAQPLALKTARMLQAGRDGAESSVLARLSGDDQHPARPGVLARYGRDVIGHFEQELQKGIVARKSLEEMRQDITDKSAFLQGAPAFWGRRIVRTELAAAHARGAWEGVREAHEQLGDMCKIMSCVDDDRTGADSLAVHGQIRKPDEAFETWNGFFQHPPDRPNDRAIVVAHRVSWPIPPYLEWKEDEEVLARWLEQQGKKPKPMPARPLMTTIPLEKFGAPDDEAPEESESPESEQEIPEDRFEHHPAPEPPAPKDVEGFTLPVPDPELDAARIAKLVAKDAQLYAKQAETIGPWEERGIDKLRRVTGSKYETKLPFEDADVQVSPVETFVVMDGLKLTHRDLREGAGRPLEHVALEDFVPSTKIVSKWDTTRRILKMARSKGVAEFDEDEARPMVFRIGDKLYPSTEGVNVHFGAAKALGLKTVQAHVIDANAFLKEKAEALAAPKREKQKALNAAHKEELARVEREVRARVAQEFEGDKEVVAVRSKHLPAEYTKKHAETYREAAPSVGWGEAMRERGLDMPRDHLIKLASQFRPGHPYEFMGDTMKSIAPGQTVRQHLEQEKDQYRARSIESAAAILAHVDAIRPHDADAITIHKFDDAVEPSDRHNFKEAFANLAGLTDKSVAMPKVSVQYAEKGRAYCQSYAVTNSLPGDPKRFSTVAFDQGEDKSVVFHEIGHALEAMDRSRGIRASAFLDARTADTEVKGLGALTGNAAYASHETARPDKFESPYVGKDYGRELSRYSDPYFGPKKQVGTGKETGATHITTEVTSMAIEKLANHWNAGNLLHKDREHFYFALGQLGGF